MPIAELLALVPAPPDPIEIEGDWTLTEAEVGVTYPSDFKELITRYGSGMFFFEGHLMVFNPFTAHGRAKINASKELRRELRNAGPAHTKGLSRQVLAA